jgi:hypothetical protein
MDKALSPTPTTTEWTQAVESGDAALVESLLASGAHVEATFERGETPLMRASARGYADVAQLLVGAGANVNARRDDGFTPLILAVFFGHEDVVRLLLEAGADASAQTKLGTTAERWAASRGFDEIVELLKEAEASRPPRPPAPEGRTQVEAGPDSPVRAETEPDAPTRFEAETEGRKNAGTQEVRPVATSSFKPSELPPEPRGSSVRRQDSAGARRRASVDRQSLSVEQQDIKARMEALVASSSVGASRDSDTAETSAREGDSFVNDATRDGATVESPRAEEISSATLDAPGESPSRTNPKGSPSSSGSRFRSVLQSWPVTAGAVVLIVGSLASVFLLRRGAETSDARPAPSATGGALQPVVPQTLPPSAESAPLPSPTVTPEVAQPLNVAPGTYDSFPFTTSPPDVTASGAPPTPGNSSNVPSVVSESGEGGGGGRATESDAPRARASDPQTREATPASPAASRASSEDEGADEDAARDAPARGAQPRAGVETRRTATQAPPPSPVNPSAPAPTPAERRKVIQWP